MTPPAPRGAPRKQSRRLACAVALTALLGLPAIGNPEAPASPETARTPYQDLARSLERSLQAERETVAALETSLVNVRDLAKILDMELQSYEVQLSAQSNLLHLPGIGQQDLERAMTVNRAALAGIANRRRELTVKRDHFEAMRLQAEERYALNDQQIREVRRGLQEEKEIRSLDDHLGTLERLLSEKRSLLGTIMKILSDQLGEWGAMQETAASLSLRLEGAEERRRREDLLVRNPLLPDLLDPGTLARELRALRDRVGTWLTRPFWVGVHAWFRERAVEAFGTWILLYAILQGGLVALRRACSRRLEAWDRAGRVCWPRTIRLLRGSLPLLGTLLFLYAYSLTDHVYAGSTPVRVLVNLLVIWQFTRWGLDILRLASRDGGPLTAALAVPHVRTLLIGVRTFGTT